ncbi:tRNA 2'-phosphotransferase 1 [Ciona intestinalis]
MSGKNFSDYQLSRELVRILRHGSRSGSIPMDEQGYVYVDDIIDCPGVKGAFRGVALEDVQKVVNSSDKKRYEMDLIGGRWKIKATQGHSIRLGNLELEPITNWAKHPVVIHGTFWSNWESIKREGLCKMRRSHIHFAEGLAGEVLSGMSRKCQVAIYINLRKALAEGVQFFQSSNKVVLSEGDRLGRIHPKYFEKVVQLFPNQQIQFDVPPDYID